MSNRHAHALAMLPLAALLVAAAPACAPLGALGDTAGSNSNSLYGEVRSVDRNRGRLQIREQYGRDQVVRIDNRTAVVYRQRQYPLSSLQRGDMVHVRVSYDRSNTAWADRVELRQPVNDRGGVAGRVERLSGTVRSVDSRRGRFTLERTRSPNLVVYLPNNARRDDVRRFDRLRRGERVSVEVRPRSGNTADLVRFR